jgi:sulfane dehydrogenase subunit SoxC
MAAGIVRCARAGVPTAQEGRTLYAENGCASRHGAGGRGDGLVAPTLELRPRDFNHVAAFKTGRDTPANRHHDRHWLRPTARLSHVESEHAAPRRWQGVYCDCSHTKTARRPSKERPMAWTRPARREFLKGGAALASGLTVGAVHPAEAQGPGAPAAAAPPPPMIRGTNEQIPYGDRSKYVTSVRIPHGNRPSPDSFGLTFHVATPLQDSVGVITPSSLHYYATTRGSFLPDINPRDHSLMIHGLVDRSLTFTMDDLKRLPSVTRLHFIECAGNRASARAKTVQESHGMTSCAEWTGVLLSTLLKECGVKGTAKWFVAEGTEEVKGASSMPIAKAMDDCLLAYGMNGEAVRPQNGFPLRLMVPGFEGIFHTKWIRRIKLVDRYYMNYNDYGHLDQEHHEAALAYQIGPKSVITFPSGSQQLRGRGFYEISGLAWSGGGAIRRVEVSTDGGKRWKLAELKGTPQRMAFARFGLPWNWDGTETVIMSRCTDELGSVQPSRAQVAKHFNKPMDPSFSVPGLDNTIMPWHIASDGSVTNGLNDA